MRIFQASLILFILINYMKQTYSLFHFILPMLKLEFSPDSNNHHLSTSISDQLNQILNRFSNKNTNTATNEAYLNKNNNSNNNKILNSLSFYLAKKTNYHYIGKREQLVTSEEHIDSVLNESENLDVDKNKIKNNHHAARRISQNLVSSSFLHLNDHHSLFKRKAQKNLS